MEKEKMTITRGLRELKLLNDRILKTVGDMSFVDCFQGRNPEIAVVSKKQKVEFETTIKEKMQSYDDLVSRRTRIKSAIMKSNSETIIKIAGKEYFVIDAIEKKTSLIFDKELLKKMRQNFSMVKNNLEANKAQLDQNIQTMLSQAFGADKKNDKDTYDQIAKPFTEANELKIIDPLRVEKRIETLDKEIADFEAEVDFVLSESNAKIEIEI